MFSLDPEAFDRDEIEDLLFIIVGDLIDDTSDLDVSVSHKGDTIFATVFVEEQDLFRVVGENGKMQAALQTILDGVGDRMGKEIKMQILTMDHIPKDPTTLN